MPPTPTFPSGSLMKGKKGLILGLANQNSIAWAIASALHAHGATMAFSYYGAALEKRVRPLAEQLQSPLILPCDVTDADSMEALFKKIAEEWGKLDFLVHAVAFSNRAELKGSFVENTTRENFFLTMDTSVFSFVDACRRAAPLMSEGGSLLTLSYLGAERCIPNYNIMGVAKAALEASTRYIARDLGPKAVRCNAISAGPIKTLAAAGIAGGRHMFSYARMASALRKDTDPASVAGAALYLLSDLGASCTGEVLHVDSGFHAIAMPEADALEEMLRPTS